MGEKNTSEVYQAEMIVKYQEMIDILMEHSVWSEDDVAPNDAFAIQFSSGEGFKDLEWYETVDGRTINLSINDSGKAYFLNMG